MGKQKYQEKILQLFEKSPVVEFGSIERIITEKKKTSYAKQLVRNLIKSEKIKEIGKGIYTKHDEISLAVFGFTPSYLGLQDALSFHNLWEQETIPVIITSKNTRKGIRTIMGNNVLVRKLDKKYMFGFELYKDGDFYFPYSDIEKTLIDLLYFKQPVDNEVLERILEKIDKNKLNEYLEKYPVKFKKRVERVIESHTNKILKPPITSVLMESRKPLDSETEKIAETLSPNERRIIPYLKESLKNIEKKSGLDETSVLRSLAYLENKNIVKLKTSAEKTVDLGDNGILYLKNGLPERRLLSFLSEKKILELKDSKLIRLSENEFKAALGALKKKALIELKDGKVILTANMSEISGKSLEEQFLESLPLPLAGLKPEQLHALESLKERKDIVRIEEKKQTSVEITNLGSKLTESDLSGIDKLLESLSPEMLASGLWKGKKFRRYDITSSVPKLSGGKKHFVNQGIEYAKRIWQDLGFEEMRGNLTQTGFWNFDALFTAQDHPVREIQDTFYIKNTRGRLPDSSIVKAVKKAHEDGVEGSKGWGGNWHEDESQRVLLRTHTTCLSARTLARIRDLKDKKGKFFSVGKCFRNETLDWSHGFEFNQTDGIVIDKNANFRHLLGYLKEFFGKMGFNDVKFVPSYFPYTEPSVEVYGYLKEKKKWIEIGGAGIFRPEVVIPLLGEYIPVLAWGPGFDRTLMDYYKIQDLREFYNNDLTKLREIKFFK